MAPKIDNNKTEHAKSDRTPVIMTEIVLPSHTNALGTIFGGVVMSWIDIAAAIAAIRYARSQAVTVSVDYLQFIVPIKLGHTVRIKAEVTHVGRTSMEIEAIVEAENSITGQIRKATHAYLTFVAVDEYGKPRPVPPLVPTTEEERKRFKEAEKRRARRLEISQGM